MLGSWPPLGAIAIVATMHGKAAAIAPALSELKLQWELPPEGFDTDRFGTFTRDVARAGDQQQTARTKALAALEACPQARIAIASEGAFGPHPACPFLPSGHEIVLLVDRETGIELTGTDWTFETNFAQATVDSLSLAERFAERIGFPGDGLVVMSADGGRPLSKDLATWEALREVVEAELTSSGTVWLEADMRAHRNARRMTAIGRAAARLAEACLSLCPECQHPGWIGWKEAGRPCEGCGTATGEIWQELRRCSACEHESRSAIDPERRANPAHCPDCNP